MARHRHVPGTLTFGWTPLRKVFAEPNFHDLILEHWHELGLHKDVAPLDPDFARCLACEDAGIFKAWTAYDGQTLVGYCAWFIQPHLHYRSTIYAVEDLFLLSAPYRRGMTGLRLFTTCFPELKKLGVVKCLLHTKVHFERERGGLTKFLVRLGFENTDNLWMKIL